jgi:hypothetical protein
MKLLFGPLPLLLPWVLLHVIIWGSFSGNYFQDLKVNNKACITHYYQPTQEMRLIVYNYQSAEATQDPLDLNNNKFPVDLFSISLWFRNSKITFRR